MTDDYTRDVNRALSDLEGNAPEPPKLADMTAGRAVLTSKEPQRWSKVAIAFAAAAVTVLVVGIAAFISSTSSPDDAGGSDIYGIWIVETYTMDGQATTIDPADFGPLMRLRPYVEITPEEVTGDDGCNDFASVGPPQFSGGLLVVGEVFASAVGCLDLVEAPLLTAMWETGEVEATVSGDAMTWTTDTIEMRFRRADRIPAPSVPAWPSQEGRLDCSPGFVLGADIQSKGVVTAPDLLTAIDDVVEIEGEGVLGSEDPYAWGLNADGVVIGGAAPGDIEPPVIHVFACAEEFGLRPDADPAGAVAIWVNDLGLGQPFPQVWDGRFSEICRTSADDLPALAERYVQEDAESSLRPGGALPTVEEATSALEIMQLSVCALPVSDTATTTLPPTTFAIETSCSALGADGPADPASFEGLSAAAEETRQQLLTSAIACDVDAIVDLVVESGPANVTDAIFWGAGRSVEELVEYDRSNQSLQRLVVALTTLPYNREEGQRVDPASGATVPEIYYTWPPTADFGDGGSVADVWDEATLEAVAALNEETVEELVTFSREFGAYVGFRVGIAEDGRWLFALAGD